MASGSGPKLAQCYIEFLQSFSNILRYSIPFPQCFHQTHPFKNSLTLRLPLLLPLSSYLYIYHGSYTPLELSWSLYGHRQNTHGISQIHFGVSAISESLTGKVPSQSCSVIKEVSVLYFPFIALLLLHSCPSLVVLKGQVLCSYSSVCNQIRFPSEYYSPALLLISLFSKSSCKSGHQVPRQGQHIS